MKKSIFLLVVTMFMFACHNDDDMAAATEPTLGGSWSLVNVFGGLAGVDNDFETGVIVWDFSIEMQQITVTNNNMTDVIFDGLPTGIYDFEVLTNGENSTLFIEFFDFDLSILTENELILDEGAFTSDGFQLTFSR